ncbi:MAG TPA: chemotaxis protein CheD [Gemmatimonadales bacterium]|nr:chemotaxis protein CheD [Gemmatimonadales bacterium]
MKPGEVVVHVAEFKVGGAGDTLVTIGLGSCVAVVLHDAEARIGGLAHILLPSPALSRRDQNPGKFPQTAVPLLLQDMVARGARASRVTARIAGGAAMFTNLQPAGTIQMGERNLVAVRSALAHHSIPLVGSEVGGDFGRTVRLFVDDGRIEVSTVRRGVTHL